jgi:hypothetical protein
MTNHTHSISSSQAFFYTVDLYQEILKNRIIVGISQLSQLRHMLATFSGKHMKNANESVTCDIFVAFRKSCWHRLNLRSKPLEKSDKEASAGNSALRAPRAETEAYISRRSSMSFLQIES